MDGNSVSAIIGALGGFLVTVVGAFFVQRRLNKKQATDNFQILFDEIRKDIGRVRDEQTQERKQWAEERKSFNDKIDKLQELIRTQDRTIHSKEIEVTELRGKVELLQSQLDTYRDAHAAKNVTVNT